MVESICRRCGKLFNEVTGEYVGVMVFRPEDRGGKVCKICHEEMKIDDEKSPWIV